MPLISVIRCVHDGHDAIHDIDVREGCEVPSSCVWPSFFSACLYVLPGCTVCSYCPCSAFLVTFVSCLIVFLLCPSPCCLILLPIRVFLMPLCCLYIMHACALLDCVPWWLLSGRISWLPICLACHFVSCCLTVGPACQSLCPVWVHCKNWTRYLSS